MPRETEFRRTELPQPASDGSAKEFRATAECISVSIWAASHPSSHSSSAEDTVTATIRRVDNPIPNPPLTDSWWDSKFSLMIDSGADVTQLSATVFRHVGLKALDATRFISMGDYAGRTAGRSGVFPVLLYLEHRRPWYYGPLDIQQYSVFLVDAHVPAEVISEPDGQGALVPSLLGQDVLEELRHKGKERIVKDKRPGTEMKWVVWDYPWNLEIRFRRPRIRPRGFPVDTRPFDSWIADREAPLTALRATLGLE